MFAISHLLLEYGFLIKSVLDMWVRTLFLVTPTVETGKYPELQMSRGWRIEAFPLPVLGANFVSE